MGQRFMSISRQSNEQLQSGERCGPEGRRPRFTSCTRQRPRHLIGIWKKALTGYCHRRPLRPPTRQPTAIVQAGPSSGDRRRYRQGRELMAWRMSARMYGLIPRGLKPHRANCSDIKGEAGALLAGVGARAGDASARKSALNAQGAAQ